MAGAYSTDDRDLALARVDHWLGADGRQAELEQAIASFLMVALPEEDDAFQEEDLQNPNFQTLLSGWLEADAPLSEYPCAAMAVLSTEQEDLAAGSRRYLSLLADSRLGFFEIQELATDYRIPLRDLLSEESCVIQGPEGSEQLETGDVLAARLLDGSHDDEKVLDSLVLLPGSAADIRILLHEYRQGLIQEGEASVVQALESSQGDRVFRKLLAPVAGRLWMAGVEA